MSKFDSDDLEMPGYFLPEDSRFRLKKLREYVEFLSHLAQPRIADEGQERLPEIRMGEVAICLELLAEQLGLVLDDISWLADRSERTAAPGPDAEPEAAEEAPDRAGGRYRFGVTLEQVDRLSRLLDMISAHGDVVIASDDAEFADHTLSFLGDAICNDARSVREIICEVEMQMLDQAGGSQTGVGEDRAAYHAGRARLPVDSASHRAGSVVESLLGDGERVRCRQAPSLGFDPAREKPSLTTTDTNEAIMKRLPSIHPGEVLLEEFLTPMGISQSALARAADMSPGRINDIVLGRRDVTVNTDARLAAALGTSKGFWLGLQADFDRKEAHRALRKAVEQIERIAA